MQEPAQAEVAEREAPPLKSPTVLRVPLTERRWFQRLIVWGALIGLYQLAAMAAGDFFLPRVESILGGIVELISDGRLLVVGRSIRQMLAGFGLAIAVGIPFGLAMGNFRLMDYVAGMYVNALFVMSLVALLPLLIIVFGVGFQFRTAVVFLFAVFFIILQTAAGVRAVDRRLIWTAKAFGAGTLKRFLTVIIPSSIPFIATGLRLGLANAFSGMILAEIWVIRDTGQILENLGLNRDLPKFFGMIVIITAIAAASAAGLKSLEKRLMPWAEDVYR